MNSFFDTQRLKADRLLQEHVGLLLSDTWLSASQTVCGSWNKAEFTPLKFKEFLNHWSDYGYGLWVLTDKKSEAIIGLAGYNTVMIAGAESVELDALFLRDYCHKGYFEEICTAIIAKTPEWELPLEGLYLILPDENELSKESRQKLGIAYERDVTICGTPHTLHRLEF